MGARNARAVFEAEHLRLDCGSKDLLEGILDQSLVGSVLDLAFSKSSDLDSLHHAGGNALKHAAQVGMGLLSRTFGLAVDSPNGEKLRSRKNVIVFVLGGVCAKDVSDTFAQQPQFPSGLNLWVGGTSIIEKPGDVYDDAFGVARDLSSVGLF